MALRGTRGRFSDDDYVASGKSLLSSRLKKLGKNPTNIVGDLSYLSNIKDEKKMQDKSKKELAKKEKEAKKSTKKINYRQKEQLEKAKNESFKIRVNPNSKSIKDRITYIEDKPKKNIGIRQEVLKKSKKGINIALIALMFVVESFALGGIYVVGRVQRVVNQTEAIPINIKEIKNDDLTEETYKVMEGYKTVYLFGLDSRTGSLSKGSNADVIMVANLNLETGDAQLFSIYRDDYLKVSKTKYGYDKINASYRIGGPEQAIKDLNDNLDLSVTEYFAFNWKSVADGINLLGGVDIDIKQNEYKYMNAFIHETCKALGGEDGKNPAAHYIKSVGMQHLNGIQAVAYGRLRLMDSDYRRTERQKEILAQCLDKAKTKNVNELTAIAEYILPQVAYNFDFTELISIIRIANKIKLTETGSIPKLDNIKQTHMGPSNDCVVPLNLEKAVKELHKSLFETEDYTPSSKVHSYSVRITELRRQFEAENDQRKAAKAMEEALESQALEAGITNTQNNSNANTNTSNNTSNNTNTSNTSNNNNSNTTNNNTNNNSNSNASTEVISEAPGSGSTGNNNSNTNNSNETYADEPERDVVSERPQETQPQQTQSQQQTQQTQQQTQQTQQQTQSQQQQVAPIVGSGPGSAAPVQVTPGSGPSSAGTIVGSGPPGSNTPEIITPY